MCTRGTAARASCGAEARRTLSLFLLRVKRGAEPDVCHSSLQVRREIPADYSLQPSAGKSEQERWIGMESHIGCREVAQLGRRPSTHRVIPASSGSPICSARFLAFPPLLLCFLLLLLRPAFHSHCSRADPKTWMLRCTQPCPTPASVCFKFI